MFFAREYPPGRQRLSDFTDAGELGVAGVPFVHRLYQFSVAHSGWRLSCAVEGGKSFAALSAGLRLALWHLAALQKSIAPTACRRGAPVPVYCDLLSAAIYVALESGRPVAHERFATLGRAAPELTLPPSALRGRGPAWGLRTYTRHPGLAPCPSTLGPTIEAQKGSDGGIGSALGRLRGADGLCPCR